MRNNPTKKKKTNPKLRQTELLYPSPALYTEAPSSTKDISFISPLLILYWIIVFKPFLEWHQSWSSTIAIVKSKKKDQLKGWPKAQHSFQCYYVALEDFQFSHKSCYKSFQHMFSFCSYHRILPSCIISAVEPECSWRRQCCINS